MVTYLLLDCHYLCNRAHYAMKGDMAFHGTDTGMLFGFFRDILELRERFATTRLVFCFDYGKSIRYQLHAGYKATRQAQRDQMTAAEKKSFLKFREQIEILRSDLLPALGFSNVLFKKTYEADDIIASICQNLKPNREAIIVGSDKDLYQLLGKRVSMYNPSSKKFMNEASFTKEWGIGPSQWADVKAMAGCSTDDIPGIAGIGEKTAVSFLTGKLKPDSVKYRNIVKNNGQWRENLELVRLPYPGTPVFDLYQDDLSVSKWNKLVKKFGMFSLLDPPF